MKSILAVIALMCTLAPCEETPPPAPLAVGSPAPEWNLENWFNSGPLKLPELRGKVVLVRWWTSPECPFCRATAPALNEFNEIYTEKGLQVVGIYTHKKATPLDLDEVKKYAALYGFKFPVAVDPSSRTLKQWWLVGDRKKWTSVSFLIDRKGVVQFIHPGGQYVKGDADYAALKAKIESLLEQK